MVSKPLPDGLVPERKFTGIHRCHNAGRAPAGAFALGAGHWGLLNVLEGSVTFVDMGAGSEQLVSAPGTVPIHPQAPHRLIVSGPVSVRIDFFVEQNAA